jgi:methylmalonyl-CoA mutase cobalamin-binding domain/chain
MDEKDIFKRLREGVVNFDYADIVEAAKESIAFGIDPCKAVNEGLVKGMEDINQKYVEDEYFLPDLIMAAEAMNEASKILFRETKNSSASTPVVLATVKGDIHDVGKNILANFLRGSGISVKDLGVNVESEDIAKAVKENGTFILGLSSMVSTSSGEIRNVINELESRGLRKRLKIIIGGSASSKIYSKIMGADAYAGDAPTGLRIIKNWIEGFPST